MRSRFATFLGLWLVTVKFDSIHVQMTCRHQQFFTATVGRSCALHCCSKESPPPTG
jgi:hypothetical protein